MDRESKLIERLFIKYSGKVYSLARFKGLSMQDSQDIVQETFVAVFASYHSFENKSSVNTYIVSIARNKIADFYRKRYKKPETELDEEIQTPPQYESVIEKTDVSAQVEKLTDEQKELLHLIFTQGLSYDEAAAVMNVPAGTIKSRMFAIRHTLKQGLGEDYR